MTTLQQSIDKAEQLSAAAREFLDSALPPGLEVVVKSRPEIVYRFDPVNWRHAVEFLREQLLTNKTPYIWFKWRENPGDSEKQLKIAAGHVTPANIAKLPRLLIRSWSEIRIYDISMGLVQ